MSNKLSNISVGLYKLAESSEAIVKELDEALEAYRACGETGPCPEWDRYKRALSKARKLGLLMHQRERTK